MTTDGRNKKTRVTDTNITSDESIINGNEQDFNGQIAACSFSRPTHAKVECALLRRSKKKELQGFNRFHVFKWDVDVIFPYGS
jgi:hypothetical protein